MAPSIGDVIRVTVKMSNGSDDVQNVFHYRIDGGAPASNLALLTDMAQALDDCYDDLVTVIPNGISFDSVELYNVSNQEYVGETAFPQITAGTAGSGVELPAQCAPLVLFRTNTLRSLGKKFLPMVYSGQLEGDGTIFSTALQAIAIWAGHILDGVTGSGYTAVPGNYRPTSGLFIEWVEAVVRDFFATQRRRYYGKGS